MRPSAAIIAALSVHRFLMGRTSFRPARVQAFCNASRRYPFATTPPPAVTVTGITITYAGAPLQYDPFTQYISWGKIQLGVAVYPTEALAEYTVEWRSSDESVATVDETGLVTPVAVGECEIVAECGGVATKCGIWVR